MEKLTDEEVINEIRNRFRSKDRAYHDLLSLTKKIEGLNDKLLESEKVKSNFLSNIKNEINNPLTSVLTLCELISGKDGLSDPVTVQAAVTSIHREALSLSFQLSNIFMAAELEAGETAPDISSIDLDSIITSAIGTLALKAEDKGVKVACEVNDSLKADPRFLTDAEKLKTVLVNLLANAIEFSPENQTVEMKVWRDKKKLFISVTDHGPGIDELDRPLIFERFRQLDTGTRKTHGGHGLGLSICRAIADLLNGVITVSGKKGLGSTFTLSLPEWVYPIKEKTQSKDGNVFLFDQDEGGTERF